MKRIVVPLVIACSTAIAFAAVDAQGPAAPGLERLTAPAHALPPGCRLQPARESSRAADAGRGSGRTTVVFAGPISLSSNPWIGSDRRTVAMIRRIVEPAPPEPDGPPLNRRESAKYFLGFADGVVAAYRAVYLASDDSVVDVYAVQFETGALAAATRRPPSRRAVHLAVRGPDVIMVAARESNPCFAAVRDHVDSLR